MEKHKKIVHKKIKRNFPFCKDCDKEISGNNSILLPYRCDCGIWEVDMDWLEESGFIEYKIKITNEK